MKTLFSFMIIISLLLAGCGDDKKRSRSRSGSSTEETQSDKMVALENARQAGILSEEEFDQKKAALQKELAETSQDNDLAARFGLDASTEKKIWTNPAPAKQQGQILKHPSGFSFWAPKGWQTKMLEGILQIHPPESRPDADNYETYFVTTESTEGVSSIHDLQVIQYLDGKMLELGQALGGVNFQRKKSAEKLDTPQGKNRGLKAVWTGPSNIGQVKAEVYTCIQGNTGCILVALGVKDRLTKRNATIKRIFNSFTVGKGKLDRQLVGTWILKRASSTTNWSAFETSYSRAQAVNESNSSLTFNADGTWQRVDQSQFLAGAGGIWLESNERKVSKGTWNADEGALYMLWEDKSFEDYKYKRDGQNLIMMSGKNGQQWQKQ